MRNQTLFFKALAVCFVSLLFGGCAPMVAPVVAPVVAPKAAPRATAPSVTPQMIATADYGAPPPADYQALTMTHIGAKLIDPLSALYEFQPPKKEYVFKARQGETQPSPVFGWLVCGNVNAKNRMGGYVGRVPFYAMFKNGQIVASLMGKPSTNAFQLNIFSEAIIKTCT